MAGPKDDLPPLTELRSDDALAMNLEDEHLETSARLTSNGRISLNITDKQCLFAKHLLPHLKPSGTRRASKECVPSWLVGDEVNPPPPLSIVIHIVGSRGDVQPFVALGKELKEKYGHRIRLATHGTFKNFVEENGLEFFCIGGDPAQLMDYMVKNPGLLPGKQSLKDGDVGKRKVEIKEILDGCWRSCFEGGDGMEEEILDPTTFKPFVADAIIANPPSFAHVHCAEKLGIPLHLMFTMPWSPTQAFPHPLASIHSTSADPSVANFMSYPLVSMLTVQGLGGIINDFREHVLGMDAVSIIWAPYLISTSRIPFTYCWSPALIPKPSDWGSHIAIAGFFFLPLGSSFKPDLTLTQFLEAGPPPVYIGFGSIVVDDPDAMTQLIFKAVKKAGVRALVSKGWGGLGSDKLEVPDDIYLLGNVPHDWLFKHVSAVCHHGGAGTCAAGIAAGRPTIVVPFFGDQPFWGSMVARSGAGPEPIPYKQLTADKLADAIKYCLTPERRAAAQNMGDQIKEEKGPAVAARHFHSAFPTDRSTCALVPKLAAAWRIKRSDVRLSSLAAAVLCDEHLLTVDDLKLNRTREYDLSEQPTDPLSGGVSSVIGSLTNFMVGSLDLPTDVIHAVRTEDPHLHPRRTSTFPVTQDGAKGLKPTVEDSQLKAIRREDTESSIDPIAEPKKHNNEHHASRALHAIGHTGAHLATLPRELVLGLARGFHNAPKLYHDRTVRKPDKVTNFSTGMKAAGKEFTLEMYDAVTGVVTQPIKGAKESGAAGFVKGVGKGFGGLVLKPEAAVLGGLGLAMDGCYKATKHNYLHHTMYEHGHKATIEETISAIRLVQGLEAMHQCDAEQRQAIIKGFEDLQEMGKVRLRRPSENGGHHLKDVFHKRRDSRHDSSSSLPVRIAEEKQPTAVNVEEVRPTV